MLTLFYLIWSQIQFLVIIDYSLGKKYTAYAVTQPERELLSNRYGSRTMLPTLYRSQVIEFSVVGSLTH